MLRANATSWRCLDLPVCPAPSEPRGEMARRSHLRLPSAQRRALVRTAKTAKLTTTAATNP
eukprot:7692465-Lingulodinium_polyedra.AAC.1